MMLPYSPGLTWFAPPVFILNVHRAFAYGPKGRLDRKASTATGYARLVWRKPTSGSTHLI
jgi:hypothetical protein